MSEQSQSLNQKWQIQKYIEWTDVLVFVGSLCMVSLNTSPYRFIFILPYLSFWYQRNTKEWIYAIAGVLLLSISQGWGNLYQNGLIVLFFILLIQFVQLLRQNIYRYLPYLCALTVALSALVFDFSWNESVLSAFISFMLAKACQSDWMWIDKTFKLSEGIFGLFVLSGLFLLSNFLSTQILFYVTMITLFLVGLCVSLPTAFVLLISMIFFYPFVSIQSTWVIALLCGWMSKKESKLTATFFFGLVLIALDLQFQSMVIIFVSFLLVSLLPLNKIQRYLLNTQDLSLNQQQIEGKRKLITHQLSQFSSIFTLISSYYKRAYPSEATFCEGMSSSLDYIALELKANMNHQESEYQKIMQILSGYHYEVTKLRIEDKMDGRKYIMIHFASCSNNDIYDVVLPLLQMVIDKNLEVIHLQKNKLFNGFYVAHFATNHPYCVKAQSIKKQTKNQCSGDMISIFRHEHATVCLLSDGMGTGEKAAKASQFIINMVQRMISANMPIESIVRSMNKLLRLENNEQFATLDVLYIDEATREAYLSKSGACPTYLLRQGKVLELFGKSLPIGIVEEIEADCYRIKCENNDLFLMVSDGVESEDIYSWLKGKDYSTICSNIQLKMEEQRFLEHQDDATVVIANFLER